jgi:hypothetical protein
LRRQLGSYPLSDFNGKPGSVKAARSRRATGLRFIAQSHQARIARQSLKAAYCGGAGLVEIAASDQLPGSFGVVVADALQGFLGFAVPAILAQRRMAR